jgi:hypothetical protein
MFKKKEGINNNKKVFIHFIVEKKYCGGFNFSRIMHLI